MRKIVLGLILATSLATPANAERFAISCKGKMTMALGPPAGPMVGGDTSESAILVIDEDAQTVGRYLKKQRTLEEVCSFHLTCDRSFSAARITIRGSSDQAMASFDWDRATGQIDTAYRLRLENGNVMASHSTFKCVPAPMPTLG